MSGGVQEYTVRVPRSSNKQHSVMQFNNSLTVDFTKWTHVKMMRETPTKETLEDDTPKFGADSEFGKEAREEARRRRFGYVAKKQSIENYPWLMKVGGKTGRRYRGVRGGGITENAAYYVFTQAKDGAFEAFPVSEWYNFQYVQRYKALSAEEAEEEFSKRDKIMNYFSVMVKKRLKNDEDAEEEGEKNEEKKPSGSKSSELKISDMDEWPDSSDGSDNSNEDAEEKEDNKKKKKNAEKDKLKRKMRKSNIKQEALEDSDDGDEEGREMDYISDSSDSDQEVKLEKEEKGVDQEDALKRLLDSDAEVEESSEEEKDKEQEEESEKNEEDDTSPQKKKKKKIKRSRKEDDSSADSDSADSGSFDRTELPSAKSASNSSGKEEVVQPSNTERIVQEMKRKAEDGGIGATSKRIKMDSSASAQLSSDTGITEEAVRRYLARKPMTTTELLQKFKSKKVGLSSDQLVPVIAQILKRINPTKQKFKGKMYLSIKK